MKDEGKFTLQYQRHFQMVWNLCYTYLHNPADVEDAVQETFVKLALSQKSFRDDDHEKAWLIVTAGNVCKDALRRGRREQQLPKQIPAQELPPEDETIRVLRAMPEPYRTAMYLFYYEELPTKQIGAILNRRDATVRSILHRGRLMMKQRLEGEK